MYLVFVFILEVVVLYFLSRKLSNKIWTVLYRLTKSKKASTYIYSFLFLPGIVFHEMAHFLSALFLFVPVGKIDLSPVFNEDEKGTVKSIRLGSVAIGKSDLIRSTLIGFSPFVSGVAVILILIYHLNSQDLLPNIAIVLLSLYVIFEIGNTMFLSRSDLKSALELSLVILALYIILYLFGVRVSFNPTGLIGQKIIDVIGMADRFLLVPVGVDFLLLGFVKIF